MTLLDRYAEGGPHRRYLFGYLDELKHVHPDWIVTVVGADDDAQYIWIRKGQRGARTTIIPVLIGREMTAVHALRRAMRDPS